MASMDDRSGAERADWLMSGRMAFLPRLSWANRFDHLSALRNQNEYEAVRRRWHQQLHSKASARRIFIHPPFLISPLHLHHPRWTRNLKKTPFGAVVKET